MSLPKTRRAMLDWITCLLRFARITPEIVSMITEARTISMATAISVAVSCASSGEKNFNIVKFLVGGYIVRWIMLVVVADDEEGEG